MPSQTYAQNNYILMRFLLLGSCAMLYGHECLSAVPPKREYKFFVKVVLPTAPALYTPLELAKRRIELIKIKKIHTYANDLSASEWKSGGDQKSCYLSQKIRLYGEVVFNRRAGYEDSLTLISWQGLRQVAPVKFYSDGSPWHPSDAPEYLGEDLLLPSNPLVRLNPILSRQMIQELREGRVIRIEYAVPQTPEQGIRVEVSPVRFNTALNQYLECQTKLLPYDLKDIQKMVLPFEATSATLEEPMKPLLDKIIRYYQAGAKIEKIIIEGHTDNAGFYELNRRVSTARAEAVKNYLIQGGVPDSMCELKAMGSSTPVGNNATKEGRAQNRRVVVQLKIKD